MKKLFITVLLLLSVISISGINKAQAQNIQLFYDAGRGCATSTVEMFRPDAGGSTFFFIDFDYSPKASGAYWEIAREFNFWQDTKLSWLSAHIEYNGGLSGGGSYNDAYLTGAAWNWANKDFSKTFSLQLLYKYLANQPSGNKHSWQITTVWGIHFAKGLCTFSGYADLWHDNSVMGNLVLSSEPQFWFNLYALDSVNDDFKLSLGAEVELTKSLVWPTDGINNKFYAIPTLAAKWTF